VSGAGPERPGAPRRERESVSGAIAAHLRPGCLVAVADGCGAPLGAGAMLADAARAVGGVRVLLGWSMTEPVDLHDPDAFTDVRTVMSGYALRAPVRDGHVRYLPTRLGSVPRLLAGALRPDALVAALRPGDRGLVFGSEVGWMRAAVDTGATVLAELNHGLPDASDGIPVPADQIVVVAETDRAPHRFTTNAPDDVAHAIAGHAAALIPEGAVLQYGPGTIADAILRAVTVPVQIDSGLVGDAVLDLDARGLVLGSTRGAYLAGTEPLYDWADGRPVLEPVEVTHDVSRLAAHDCFVAINTALEIDPVGQVNVERVGGQPVGGIGGHADFALAASRSRRGVSMIALPSMYRAGPTLVDRLSAPVTTVRADVDVVVTEHGVADLRGLDDRERERALRALWDRA
jgi:acyl-CoA hydrolase